MLLNYFNIAFRNLLKNRLHTVINVSGLALGIASVFLIALYIQGELSYDRFHHDAKDLYRISWINENPQTRTPHPMAQALVQDFPEVASAVSLTPLWAAGLTRETHSFRNPKQDIRYDEKNILAVDTTFFDVFDFPLVKGNPKTALRNVRGLLISESVARKYFGDEDPLGKQLYVDSDIYLVEVVGVFKDVPPNSHFHFDFLISYLREKSFEPGNPYFGWRDFGHYNYIRLKPGSDAKALEAKLMDWSRRYIHFSDETFQYYASQHYGFKLQPVTDIHLHSRLRWELEPNGNMEYIYILGAAALLTLVIACVNFMNLTTAKSAERAKEIGVRKTLGAARAQLSLQFLSESAVIALCAVALSLVMIELALPFFNAATGLSFRFIFTDHFPALLLTGMVIGLISGLYPSFYLSAVKPHLILKGKLTQSRPGSHLRQGLIVFQFSVSMFLISAAIIVFHQLRYLESKNLGFSKEEVIVIPVKNEKGMEQFDVLRNELLRIDGIAAVSASSNIPGKQFNQHPIAPSHSPDDDIASSEAFVDYDFFQTMGIELAEGRTFLRENAADTMRTFVINETAAKQLNFGGPAVGQEINWHRDGFVERGTIIGVVKDFHFQSLHEPVRPLVFTHTDEAFNYILVRLNPENLESKMAAVEKAYKKIEPIFGFEYEFLDDQLNAQYASEQRTGAILGTFSFIAVTIACFGLFGMSMLAFHQKTKEVSVRKVLGASAMDLVALLAGGFTRLILAALVIAVPFTWFLMDHWLDNFSYQVTISPVVFVVSALLLLIISWFTLSYFTIKASRLNPAETLKNE